MKEYVEAEVEWPEGGGSWGSVQPGLRGAPNHTK